MHKMKVTKELLKELYAEYNQTYFDGVLGECEFHLFPKTTGLLGAYRDRVDSDVATGRRVFRDVLWSVGAGADLIVSTHLALRPDVSLLIVTTRRDARVVPVYGLHLAYYFVPRDRAQ